MYIRLAYSKESETISFAASELKYYLSKITNSIVFVDDSTIQHSTIALELFPDSQKHSDTDDEYHIEISKGNGHIYGSNSRSVLLGIYKYLTLLGCRFLRPGKAYEYLPMLSSTEDLNICCHEKAENKYRGVCIEGADCPENIFEFIDWLPKLGFNTFFLQFELPYAFLNLWYSHKNNPMLSAEEFSLEKAAEISLLIDKELQKRSLKHHRVGHGWTCSVLNQNTLGWVEADNTLDKSQLPLTALVNGERGFFGGIPINTNLCYSNPDVVESFAEKVVAYAKKHPEVDYLHVWLADAANNHCECENCQKSIPTDLYVRILNRIDALLTEKKLKTKIVFLIYEELLWAPQKEEILNPDRFVMMFAPISRTFKKSYQMPKELPASPAYVRNKITLPVNLEENLSFLSQWQKTFNGECFDYDYPLGRAHYGDMGYVHISKIIYDDIKYLKALHLDGYISCQELRAFLPNGLPNYVMGKCLFGTTQTFEELAEEYFSAAYGENWKIYYQYLSQVSALCDCDYFNGKGPRENKTVQENMMKLKEVLLRFKKNQETFPATHPSAITDIFCKHLDYHNEYCILLANALYYLAGGEQENTQKAWKDFHDFICSHELDFQKALDVYRVIEVSTNYAGFPVIGG